MKGLKKFFDPTKCLGCGARIREDQNWVCDTCNDSEDPEAMKKIANALKEIGDQFSSKRFAKKFVKE